MLEKQQTFHHVSKKASCSSIGWYRAKYSDFRSFWDRTSVFQVARSVVTQSMLLLVVRRLARCILFQKLIQAAIQICKEQIRLRNVNKIELLDLHHKIWIVCAGLYNKYVGPIRNVWIKDFFAVSTIFLNHEVSVNVSIIE
jgi:hypothetical protein